MYLYEHHITDFAQDFGNSIANALELPQFCAKPSILFPITELMWSLSATQ